MKQTQLIMGMPITVEIADKAFSDDLGLVFDHFRTVDRRFSTYKPESEISRLNRGEIREAELSNEMKEVIRLSAETRELSGGYFDIRRPDGKLDPSGLVKGWAIREAAKLLSDKGYQNFFIEAGGDIEVRGLNALGRKWRIGIRNPFDPGQVGKFNIVKILELENLGIATSGTYLRGYHIYDPHTGKDIREPKSLSVIGPDVFEADRIATAAFAMGILGFEFVSRLPGFEAYEIQANGSVRMTRGLNKYCLQ